jgi:hypothetical protein
MASQPTGESRILRNGNKGRGRYCALSVRMAEARKRRFPIMRRQRAILARPALLACRIGAYKFSQGRDPDFAEQWRVALSAGFDRLQAMLIERAMGLLTVIGDTPMPDVSTMDEYDAAD